MDKDEFVIEAPIYYALAIAAQLTRAGDAVSREQISKKYFYRYDDDDPDSSVNLLNNTALWARGIQWLQTRGMIHIRTFPFGSPVYISDRGVLNAMERPYERNEHFRNLWSYAGWRVMA